MSNWSSTSFRATDLISKITNKEIKVPQYQRGQVWKPKMEESLIDSIKKGFPFGTLLLYKNGNEEYLLIDGLQRSTTLYKYLNNPAKFFKPDDITDETLDKIYDYLEYKSTNKSAIKSKLKGIISEWVTDNHKTMQDVANLNANDCVIPIVEEFVNCPPAHQLKIANVLVAYFSEFKNECQELSNTEIPAIVYTGASENLPEVFSRINSKGTVLSKYQILAATWTSTAFSIVKSDLADIEQYVKEFYVSLQDGKFAVDGFDANSSGQMQKMNLYQVLFGFGKVLSNKYPKLFVKPTSKKEVESCAFNLVNACVGNKNSNLSDLESIIIDTFDNQEFNDFLSNILWCTKYVYRQLKSYIDFKLNTRNTNTNVYHSEMQICSMIASVFNAKYADYTTDENGKVIARKILTSGSNTDFDTFKKQYQENAFKKYLVDMMNNKWKGTGDKSLDEISLYKKYYTENISEDEFKEVLEYWYTQVSNSKHEVKKIPNPAPLDKLLLSVIYVHSFSAFQQNGNVDYDIEHLAPKKALKDKLGEFYKKDHSVGLPISSFANLCILEEEINRKKKDKSLYQDSKYLQVLSDKNIKLEDVECNYSFTKKEDLDWLEEDFDSFEDLKDKYQAFLDKRFVVMEEKIIESLYK